MKLPIIRPARPDDLEDLFEFATESGYGITSLPRHKQTLEKKLHASALAFQEKLLIPKHETYQFCLEWEGCLIGTSAIISRIGLVEPFFAYHILHERQTCTYLHIDRELPVLHFTRAQKKPTEIGSLFLTKSFRQKHFGKLLSISRFLFIACFKSRFASTVIAELRGINHNGHSPFWEAVGRPFFQIDFSKADFLRMEYHSCIEELFPKYPIYVAILPKEAQSVISVPHPDTIPAQMLLKKQGFKISHYVDLFDAGPHMYAPTEKIHAVESSHEAIVQTLEPVEGPVAILSNTRLDFRATLAPIKIEDNHATLPPETAEVLKIVPGDVIRYYFP